MKKFFLIFVVLSSCVIVAPFTARAQEYDYHKEESPAVSWNGTALFDARMLAAGGVSLMASPAFAASINPALIPSGDNIFMGASFEVMKHEAFQYWGVNQGIYGDPETQSHTNYHLSGFTLTFPVKDLRFSAGWYIPNLLELPAFDYDGQYWAYSINSPGIENAFFAAAAVKLGKIDVGVKLDYVSGKRDVEINENWKEYPLQIQHQEKHRLNYLAASLGVVLNISPAWTVGSAVVYPFEGTVDRSIDRIFESNYERIEILGLESTDPLYRPPRFYLGATFAPLTQADNPGQKKLIFAAEAVYILWSDYQYEFYSEILPREMRNILVIGLGMEYSFSDYFFRLGYRLDPQPITEPDIILQAITGGIGMQLNRISLDIGAAYYFSSYQGVQQKHLVLNSTMYIRLGGK